MARIFPFRAVRPTRDKVSLVTSRSFEDYAPAELAAQLEFNPLSFLHILKPAYTFQQSTVVEKRFKLVHQKYEEFKHDNILARDEKPSVYIHRIRSKSLEFTGIISAVAIDDLKTDNIKKHEDTLHYRVELFKDYMKFAGFNTEPVLMTHPDDPELASWLADKTSTPADFEFSTTKRDIHYLWKIDDVEAIAFIQSSFERLGALYIADGHHRCASAEMLYDESDNPSESKSRFMGFLISDSQVKVYEYNRLIKDLNGLSRHDFLDRLAENFVVKPSGEQLFHPKKRHEFGLYLDGDFFALELREDKRQFESPLEGLDAQILYDRVLKPILGITDLRNDERIEYLPGKIPVVEIRNRVDEGEFELGFVLYPTDISEIKAIADARQIMPPKSTYIEPKFRSGLVVYEID
jgi:uncharacterized protein (DUF1015 family)